MLFVAALLLGGCATTPTPTADAKSAPADRVLAFQDRPVSDAATIVLTRDSGFLGGGCFYAFWISGTLAARLGPGETSRFLLKPGEHLLRSGRDPQGQGLCQIGQDEWTQRETILRSNEVKHFRLLIDLNGKTDIQRMD